MQIVVTTIFFLSIFVIFWAMVGYPISLKPIHYLFRNRRLKRDYSYEPTVTVMIVAHNEEKVIRGKLENVTELEYPKDKIEYLVASDNSTDRTNDIVKDFIDSHPENRIRLYEVKKRKGKINAQNEAQKTINSEIIVMTDANSMMKENSVRELISAYTAENISYVCGRMVIINKNTNAVANSENIYWDNDLKLREIESDIQSITAGNGAIYSCRNKEYIDFIPIRSHDEAMPLYFALNKKRAIYNPESIAYEKASETIKDEFKRKVRMNRGVLRGILPDIRLLNIVKYRWFSYFYFGHRTCRYLLWIAHLLLLIMNGLLAAQAMFYMITLACQILFYLLAIIKFTTKTNNFIFKLPYYYCVTVIAQWVGIYKIATGTAVPFWEKAESTR